MVAKLRKLYNKRVELQAKAKGDYIAAQEAYEKATATDLATREKLRRLAEKAKTYWDRRRVLTGMAKSDLDAAQVPALKPERTHISVNRSSRRGIKPRLIVLHITVSHNRPGLPDLDAILDFFGQPSTQASSHIVNDAEGHDARCVNDVDKAWTQAAYNPQSLSVEQIEMAAKSTERWMTENRKQLENTALWIAYWSHKYGIPITHSTVRGVCEHRELGAAGGGHSDVGAGYPLAFVLKKAAEYRRAKYGR